MTETTDGTTVNGPSPEEIQAQILKRIASGEAQQYNTLYGGGSFQGYADHPRQSFVGPDGRPTSAAGLYQFQQGTWDEQAKKLGLKDFTPASQDKAAWDLAQSRYRAVTGKDLASEWRNGNTDLSPLAPTWTSLGKGASAPVASAATAPAAPGRGVGAGDILASAPAGGSAMAGGSPQQANANALRLLEMMQKLAPQHKFTPVDYDPWKYVPKS
jgi:hypothetical protein